MEADDARLQAVILAVVSAQPFHYQLFPAVGILGLGRVGIFLLERCDMRIHLLVLWIDASRGSVEVALHPIEAGGFQRVGVDQRVVVQDFRVMR